MSFGNFSTCQVSNYKSITKNKNPQKRKNDFVNSHRRISLIFLRGIVKMNASKRARACHLIFLGC